MQGTNAGLYSYLPSPRIEVQGRLRACTSIRGEGDQGGEGSPPTLPSFLRRQESIPPK